MKRQTYEFKIATMWSTNKNTPSIIYVPPQSRELRKHILVSIDSTCDYFGYASLYLVFYSFLHLILLKIVIYIVHLVAYLDNPLFFVKEIKILLVA